MDDVTVDFDGNAVRSRLSELLDRDVVDVRVLHDGLNLSLAVDTAAEADAYVIRRPNKFRDTESFIDVRREYGVLDRLQDTPVPAPRPVHLETGDSLLGGPFLVTTHLDGEAVHLGSRLPERFQHPDARRQFGEVVVATLADLHAVEVGPFEDVCRRRSPRDQVEETIGRMETATATTGHEPPRVWDVADWLRDNVPPDSATTLCHGDYRPGNLHFVGDDLPAISGVLDWETAFLGDPLGELGYLLLRWRDEGDPTPEIGGIAARHPDANVVEEFSGGRAPGLAPYSARPGSPTRRELVALYETRTGVAFEHDRFYRAFAAFVLAAVWADIYRTEVESGQPREWEPKVEYVVLVAERIAGGEYPL